MPVFGACRTSSVEDRGQEFTKQCLSLLLCPPGSLLMAFVPPLLTSSYLSTQNMLFLPAPHATLLSLFPCQTCSRVMPGLCLFQASACLPTPVPRCAAVRLLIPVAQKVPFDFSRNILLPLCSGAEPFSSPSFSLA